MRHHPSLAPLCGQGRPNATVGSSTAMNQARGMGDPLPRGGFVYTGIEIEVENANLGDIDPDPWNVVADGSLRNMGVELISRPIRTNTTLLRYLNKYTRLRNEHSWSDSIRTSTHVHLDARGLNIPDIMKILAAYILVEPFLYRNCGPLREENIYCVPLYRADTITESLVEGVLNGSFLRKLRDSCKYSGFYLGPLCTFGTIEFRMAPSYPTGEAVLAWVQALHHLYNAALEAQPQQMHSQLEVGEYSELIRTLLPPAMHHLIPADPLELADIMEDNTCDQRAMSVCELWLSPAERAWVMPEMPVVESARLMRGTRRGLTDTDVRELLEAIDAPVTIFDDAGVEDNDDYEYEEEEERDEY